MSRILDGFGSESGALIGFRAVTFITLLFLAAVGASCATPPAYGSTQPYLGIGGAAASITAADDSTYLWSLDLINTGTGTSLGAQQVPAGTRIGFSGRLTDSSGQAIAGAWVALNLLAESLNPESGSQCWLGSTQTDADGNFEAGYYVEVRLDGWWTTYRADGFSDGYMQARNGAENSGCSAWAGQDPSGETYSGYAALSNTAYSQSASFQVGLIEVHAFTVSAGPGGAVSGSQSGTYVPGTPVSVTANPLSGYQFSSWSISGASCSGDPSTSPCVFSMPSNGVTLTATFTGPPLASTMGRWNTDQLTYSIAGCDATKLSKVNAALQEWRAWLPGVSFTQVTADEKITIECTTVDKYPGGSVDDVRTYPDTNDPTWPDGAYKFNYAYVGMSVASFTQGIPNWDINVVAHSLGHALGLPDNYVEGGTSGSGLMGSGTDWNTGALLTPTPAELAALVSNFAPIPPAPAPAGGVTVSFFTNPASGGTILFNGLTFGSAVTHDFDTGTYTAAAVAASGFVFKSWQTMLGVGVASTTSATTTATVTGLGGLIANFDPAGGASYALIVSAGSGGTISGTPSGSYAAGTAISVTANPTSGYTFSSWSISGASCGGGVSSNPCAFSMTSSTVSVAANFATASAATITATWDDGSKMLRYNGQGFTPGGLVDGYIDGAGPLWSSGPVAESGETFGVYPGANLQDGSHQVYVKDLATGSSSNTVSFTVGTSPIQPDTKHTFGHWNTRQITFRVVSCDSTKRAAILDAFQNWRTWLPTVTFTEVSSNEQITFECTATDNAYSADDVRTYPDTTDPNYDSMFPTLGTAYIGIGPTFFTDAYDQSGGRNISAHAIGHALGLKDNVVDAGGGCGWGLMGYCWIYNKSLSAQIQSPTQGELQELAQNFAKINA